MTDTATPNSQAIRNAVATTAIVFGLTVAATAPAAACNPFEFLFGGCRETQTLRPPTNYYYYYRPVQYRRAPVLFREFRHKAKPEHGKSPTTEANGVSGKQKPLDAKPDAPMGSLALFAQDPTLRAGDIVVTKAGFRVYAGHGSFEPIARKDGKLAELQKVSMEAAKAAAAQTTATAAPAPEPAPTQSVQAVTPPNSWVGVRREASLGRN